jgi:hypothetical protein
VDCIIVIRDVGTYNTLRSLLDWTWVSSECCAGCGATPDATGGSSDWARGDSP